MGVFMSYQKRRFMGLQKIFEASEDKVSPAASGARN